jgi:hypothetical protein
MTLPSLPQPSGIPGTTMSGALCDASCSVLQTVGLGGWVSSGTGIDGGGKLEYLDGWQGECRVSGGPLNGRCRAVTGCPPGQQKFSDGGVWKCRLPELAAPAVPSLPAGITVHVTDVTR